MPKYHVRMGFRVYFITTTWSWNNDGNLVCIGEERYVNRDGIEVIRIENDQNKPWDYRIKTHSKLIGYLEELEPNIIFLHCCQVRDSKTIAEYIKNHPSCKLYVDNHADYSNSATNWLSRNILHRIFWRHYANLLIPYAEKFWGVLPARVDFLVDNYGIPREKCDLLVMGADDDEVERASNRFMQVLNRNSFGFTETDFVVVTGGKIDYAKRQTLLLMDAINEMSNNVKMLMFGPVSRELWNSVEERLSSNKIIYKPWANVNESYDYFSLANVVVFPGRHSVYWEQVVGIGKPLIVKSWPGTQHIDCCGNALFLENDDVNEIRNAIEIVMENEDTFDEAAKVASKEFLYSRIAAKGIGYYNQ